MLIQTVIKVNNSYYTGESEEAYNSSFKGVGWIDYKSSEINKLSFSHSKEDAKVIEGNRNLKSEIDKIMQRVQDGLIELINIEIIKL